MNTEVKKELVKAAVGVAVVAVGIMVGMAGYSWISGMYSKNGKPALAGTKVTTDATEAVDDSAE